MAKTRSFSIYLLKDDLSCEEALSSSAKDQIGTDSCTVCDPAEISDDELIEGSGLASSAAKSDERFVKLFVFRHPTKPVKWLSDASTVFENVPSHSSTSTSGVGFFEAAGRLFAFTYGHGWQYLDDRAVVSDFGLRVAINSLKAEKIKRVDSSHLSEALHAVAQSAFQRDFQSFGIEDALELVRRISGNLVDDDLANGLSGATALKLSREMEIDELPALGSLSLARYSSRKYISTPFEILDKVRPILDPVLTNNLFNLATAEIKDANSSQFELAAPYWNNDDVVYFGFYGGVGKQGRSPELLLSHYRNALGASLASLTSEDLGRHGVKAELFDGLVLQSWTIKKCLMGSIVKDGHIYAVCDGGWYQIDTLFKNGIQNAVSELVSKWDIPPPTVVKKCKTNSRQAMGYESEGEYNKRFAKSHNLICLDAKDIYVTDIPYGKFEACDLLDIPGKRFIHVKKGRKSSDLSHLFRQGAGSAKILKNYPAAADEVSKAILAVGGTDQNKDDFLSQAHARFQDWTVEFCVMDSPDKNGNFNIPFFSRITLKQEAQTLLGMQYKVALKFIPF